MIVILPNDHDIPAGHFLFKDYTPERIIPMFTGKQEDGWLYALGTHEKGVDGRKALEHLLDGMEEAIGTTLEPFLKRNSVTRVTIIPHMWLHLVPFWAIPSLIEFEIMMAPSAAHFVNSGRAKLMGQKALTVEDPTMDLPLSEAEIDYVRQHLSHINKDVQVISKENATEERLLKAVPGNTVFHFCGHGISDLIQPLRSALLLHKDNRRFPEKDPFKSIIDRIVEWHDLTAEEQNDGERYADLPEVGRVYERHVGEEMLERRLEYSESRTLFGLYDRGRLVRIGDLLTVGNIMVERSFENCSLAFLSACESGIIGLSNSIEEYSSLPAALQLEGVSTVVSTLWPISQELAVIYVNLFYRTLSELKDTMYVAAIIRKVNHHMRPMKKGEAEAMFSEIEQKIADPVTRFKFEARVSRLLEKSDTPFSHPYNWGAFFAIGSNLLILKEMSNENM